MRSLIANAAPGAVRAEAGGHREARRRLPLRGLRLHRARRRHGAAARGPAAQAGVVRQDRTAAIEVRIVDDDGNERRAGRAGRAVHPHHARDGRLPPHRRAACSELDEGGWKSVGDVAYVDDEGYLYICDRKKDMIISGGVNIYPAEIEAVLYEHPQVLDVAVFGIPDDEWGESVYAIVQPKPGEAVDLDELAGVRRRARSPGTSGHAATRCATSCRAPTPASCSSGCCATSSGRTATPRGDGADVRWRADAVRSTSRSGCSPQLRRPRPRRAARVDDADAAVAAADELGYPVVVKLVRRRDRAQDRARPRAARARATPTRCATRRPTLLAAATPDDGEVELLVAPMVQRQPRADRRACTATRSSGRA